MLGYPEEGATGLWVSHTPHEMGLLSKARIEANPVGGIILCCCGCFVDVYEKHFERLSANAYIEAL